MEKCNLRVTLLCVYFCVCLCGVHGTLSLGDKGTHQNHETQIRQTFDRVKKKPIGYNQNSQTQLTNQIYDKLTTKNVFRYNENGHLKPSSLSINLVRSISDNHGDETRPSYAWKDVISLSKSFKPDTGQSTKRQSIVQSLYAFRQEKKLNSHVPSSRRQWRFNKPHTKGLKRNNYVSASKGLEFLEQYKRLESVFYQTIQLQNDDVRGNTGNDIHHHVRPSLQKTNQYPTFVHRVRKSVNQSESSSVTTSKGGGVLVNQSSSQNTYSAGSSKSDSENNSVKSGNISQSSTLSKTSTHWTSAGIPEQTNGVHMVTLSSTLAVNTNKLSSAPTEGTDDDKSYTANTAVNVKSSTQTKLQTDFEDSTKETLSSTTAYANTFVISDENSNNPESTRTSSVSSENFQNIVGTRVQSTPKYENRENDTEIISSSQVITKTVQQGQTTHIPKPDPTEQENLALHKLTSITTRQTETSAQTLHSAQNTKSLLHSTESSVLPLSTAYNASQLVTTVNNSVVNLSTTVRTSPEPHTQSTSEPPTTPKSLPEPASPTNNTEMLNDETASLPPVVTEGSKTTPASVSQPELTTAEESSSSSQTTESGRSSPEPETTERSHSKSSTLTSLPSVTAEFMKSTVDNLTTLVSTKQTVIPITLATETNVKQNSTLASTVTRGSTVNNVETTSVSSPSYTTTHPPKPKQEPVVTQEPTPEPNSPYDSDKQPEGVAEPGPDWLVAKTKWKFAWPAHLYLFGSVFTLIAMFVIASMIQLWQINRLLSRRYFFTLNMLIFYFCVVRAFYLLFDGYNSNGLFPDVLQYFLYSSVFPCLTSAFSILLFSLLTATQMQLVPPRIQKLKYLIVVILIHFLVQISSDIVVGLSAGARMMLFVCQLLYIVWGLFLFCGYSYVFRTLYYSAVKRQKTFQYTTSSKTYLDETNSERKKFTLSLAVKVTLLAAIFGLATVVLEVYSIVSVYGIMSDKQPEAWAWWIYHTALRLTECLMCLTMSYVASQPFRYNQKYTHCVCYVLCAPCLEMCSCHHPRNNDSLGWEDNSHFDLHSTVGRSNGQMNGKKKVHMRETADIVPVVVQPGSGELSRPTSLLIIEDGYVRFQTENDINKIVDSYTGGPRQEMLTFKSGDGIINGAYLTIEDQFSLDRASSHDYARKSSLASSDIFHPPSSLSLADSMDMEIDKALRSLHDTGCSKTVTDSTSWCGTLTKPAVRISDREKGPTIAAYLEDQASHPLPMLRRSRSALGDVSDERRESWRQKLFRSRSDNSNCIKTKEVDNLKYFSLLDLERQHALAEHKNVDRSWSGQCSSDDMFMGNCSPPTTPAGDLSQNSGAARRLLTSNSDIDDIDV